MPLDPKYADRFPPQFRDMKPEELPAGLLRRYQMMLAADDPGQIRNPDFPGPQRPTPAIDVTALKEAAATADSVDALRDVVVELLDSLGPTQPDVS